MKRLRSAVLVMGHTPGGFELPSRCLTEQTRMPNRVIWVIDDQQLSLADLVGGSQESWRGPLRWESNLVERVPWEHPTYGAAIAANYGLDRVHDDIDVLVLLNERGWVRPDWLEAHLGYYEAGLPVPLVSGSHRKHIETSFPRGFNPQTCVAPCHDELTPFGYDEQGKPLQMMIQYAPPPGRIMLDGSARWVTGGTKSVRLDLARKVGGWDERLDGGYGGEDHVFACRIEAVSGIPPLVSTDPRLTIHRLKVDRGGKQFIRDIEEQRLLFTSILMDPAELVAKAWRTPR